MLREWSKFAWMVVGGFCIHLTLSGQFEINTRVYFGILSLLAFVVASPQALLCIIERIVGNASLKPRSVRIGDVEENKGEAAPQGQEEPAGEHGILPRADSGPQVSFTDGEEASPEKYKMVIVMRTDLGMGKGKMVVQGAHAASMCFFRNQDDTGVDVQERITAWLLTGNLAKVCLRVSGEKELDEIEHKARAGGVEVCTIMDAGHTTFRGKPTKTCLALGPNRAEAIDAITSHLRLL